MEAELHSLLKGCGLDDLLSGKLRGGVYYIRELQFRDRRRYKIDNQGVIAPGEGTYNPKIYDTRLEAQAALDALNRQLPARRRFLPQLPEIPLPVLDRLQQVVGSVFTYLAAMAAGGAAGGVPAVQYLPDMGSDTLGNPINRGVAALTTIGGIVGAAGLLRLLDGYLTRAVQDRRMRPQNALVIRNVAANALQQQTQQGEQLRTLYTDRAAQRIQIPPKQNAREEIVLPADYVNIAGENEPIVDGDIVLVLTPQIVDDTILAGVDAATREAAQNDDWGANTPPNQFVGKYDDVRNWLGSKGTLEPLTDLYNKLRVQSADVRIARVPTAPTEVRVDEGTGTGMGRRRLKGGIKMSDLATAGLMAAATIPGMMLMSRASKAPKLFGGETKHPVVENVITDEDMADTNVSYYNIRNKGDFEKKRAALLEALDKITIPKIPQPSSTTHSNRGNVIGTIGRTITFGFGDNRHGWNEYATNTEHPEVFKALIEFGNAVVPKGFDYQGISVNHMVKAKKHKDRKNIGKSVIIGIGDYTGGNLRVWDGNDKNMKSYDIHNKPLMFNGGLLYHQTEPFKGNRYTFVFYKQKKGPKSGKVNGYRLEGRGELSDDVFGGRAEGAIYG